MEHYPLNKAHQLERRAEALMHQRRFEDSIECHKNAIKHLHDTFNSIENRKARESIQLQIDRHHKLVDSLRIKKLQYEDHKRHQENLRHRLANFDKICEDGGTLQTEIFRTMQMHDSLIGQLMHRGTDEDSPTSDKEDKDALDGTQPMGKKRQVDDATLLEEFKGLSETLKELLQVLLEQLEDKDLEILRLKSHINKLEAAEKNKDNYNQGSTLKVADLSGSTSPYVFSPCSDFSPSPEVKELRELPSLAPLEMPDFDFSTLTKNTSKLDLNNETTPKTYKDLLKPQ